MLANLYKEFQYPGAEFRGKPFWSWNGKLDKEELLRQVHVMKEMGFGGYFMHSRTGLVTEYLGEEWFDLINACADEGEKLGMEAWLYDEDRWPSGTVGGIVTQEPKYRLKFIYLQIVPVNEFHWKEDMIAAFSCKMDGINYSDCIRLDRDTSVEACADRSILVFSIVEAGKSSFYNGFTYVDTLNREATEKFIELTHEKYKEFCGDRLGKSIKGIFTDEPHRGALMDGFSVGNANGEWHAPWTYTLFDRFKEKYGYDLLEKLPELFLRPEGKVVSQVKWHYTELLQEMFIENFAKPINEWCIKNQLILTGHVLHEDSLTAQTAMQGSLMRFYEHMGYPGVDVLTEFNNNFWIVKQLQSAARQLGQKWLLSELYGCSGWQMDFESHKAVGNWQALFGINLRCHHLSWYTMEGEAKRDYPASIFHQSTWWREYKYVEDYFSRIGVMMTQGLPVCDVLVINPVESVWCQVYAGWSIGLGAQSPEVQRLEEMYRNLFYWLQEAQIDFDYGDEEMTGRLYSIQYDQEHKPVLKVGEAGYRVVVIGGATTLRATTLKLLEEFVDAGGKVVFAGEVPSYVDAAESDAAFALAGKALCVSFERGSIVKACKENTKTRVEVMEAETGEQIREIYCQVREEGVNKYILFMNINREKAFKNVRVRIYEQGYAEEWNCADGQRYFAGQANENGYIDIITDFAVIGERVFVITENRDESIQPRLQTVERNNSLLDGIFDYRMDEPNICVLDMAGYKINDGEWQPPKEILKVDREIRRQLGLNLRGGEMIQPWYAKKSGYEVKCNLTLAFEFFVKDIPQEPLALVLESPESFKIRLNGHLLEEDSNKGWWVDRCFAKIPFEAAMLKEGSNTVELEAGFHQGMNLEALYLLGNYGVQLDGNCKTLTELPEKIEIGDLVNQGFPFYTGKITYIAKVDYKPRMEEKVFLSLESFEAACVKVSAPGKETRMIAWQPYETDITEFLTGDGIIELEAVLTRRNTFGPLHQVPIYMPGYGPDSFISEGDMFSENYMLVPSGLVTAPRISIR